jgi:hypothetical protein
VAELRGVSVASVPSQLEGGVSRDHASSEAFAMVVTTQPIVAQRLVHRRAAIRFIVLIGFVSLFGDMTYESARSLVGPYLGTLGASATVVGVVAGFGELIGYVLRLLSSCDVAGFSMVVAAR